MRTLMYTLSRICLAGILFMGTGPFVWAQEKGFSTEVQTELQQVLNDFVNNPSHPYVGGLSVAVKIDDLAFWQGAAGYASRAMDPQTFQPLPYGLPFTEDLPSRIYSVTKTFTAALVLELVREGQLSLEDHVSEYIDLASINPALTDVTLHQLLAHETGYTDFWTEPLLMGAVANDPTRIWTAQEALAYVHQTSLPEGVRSYSNTNYIMLGVIIETVTNKTVEMHFRERFFEPLGLESMYLAGQDDIKSSNNIAAPHDNLARLGLPAPDWVINMSFIPFDGIASLAFTSGGIISNVADLAEWGSALFGGRATSKETLRTMLKSIDRQPDEDGDYLGYGIWRTTKISSTETFIGHDGNAPGYRSVMFYQPERRLTIAILSNDRGSDLYQVAKALFEVLLEDFYCGNENSRQKIELCHNGAVVCVDYPAAVNLVRKGAAMGVCESGVKQGPQTGNPNQLKAHPNPVNNRTVFSFVPEQSGMVSLRLYDVNGTLKVTLFEGTVEKGVLKQVVLDRGSLNGGVYFARLQTATGISQHKVVLNR